MGMTMYDPADSEKLANAALHQRAALMSEITRLCSEADQMSRLYAAAISRGAKLHELLEEIGYLVEGRVDIDQHGGPNLAMQIKSVLDRK
jgi:hypothetical protein